MIENQEYSAAPTDYLWCEGRWEELLPLVQADCDDARRQKAVAREADELASLGFLYGELGRHMEAVMVQRRELRLRRILGDQEQLAFTLRTLGLALKVIGALHSSLRCLRIALIHFRAMASKAEEFSALEELGDLMISLGQPMEALKSYQAALEQDPHLQFSSGRAGPRVLKKMASLHQSVGDLGSAYANQYRATAALCKLDGAGLTVAEGLMGLGQIQRRRGREWEAQEYFRESMEVFARMGDLKMVKECQRNLRGTRIAGINSCLIRKHPS